MKRIIYYLDLVTSKIQEAICMITEVYVCAMIVFGAILRYIFQTDFFGAEELILFGAFWLYFIGSAQGTKEDSHINADMTNLFIKNIKTKKILNIYKYSLSFILTCVCVAWGWHYIMWTAGLHATTNVYKLPLALAQLPILIGFVLSAIYLIGHIVRSVKLLKGGDNA